MFKLQEIYSQLFKNQYSKILKKRPRLVYFENQNFRQNENIEEGEV